MTWYDQAKCQEFLKIPDGHFKTTKVINLDIIRRETVGEKVPEEHLKNIRQLKMRGFPNTAKESRTNFSQGHLELTDLTFSLRKK